MKLLQHVGLICLLSSPVSADSLSFSGIGEMSTSHGDLWTQTSTKTINFGTESKVVVQDYEWLDAIKLGVRGAINPSVFSNIEIGSTIKVDEITKPSSYELLDFTIRSAASSDSSIYAGTGYGVIAAMSDDGWTLVDEIVCSSDNCRFENGNAFQGVESLPQGTELISTDKDSLKSLGGRRVEISMEFNF